MLTVQKELCPGSDRLSQLFKDATGNILLKGYCEGTIAQVQTTDFNLAGGNSPPLCGETSSLQCQPVVDDKTGFIPR
ncbi:MAG TPA: hypothetical protein V6C84_08430 [Coleofasciculaceae cyanobacterium]